MDFNCNYCNKIYKSNSARIFHYRKTHNELYEKDKIDNLKIKKKYKCLICNNLFASSQSKYNHSKKCKIKQSQIKEINEISELKNTVLELKDTVSLLTKQLGSKLNINNGTINNINNNINNGTINIIKFGNEDSIYISKEEFLKIANKQYDVLNASIAYTHLNNKRPELHNIIITDLTDDYAYIFNGTIFIAGYKDDILDKLIDTHVEIIKTNFFEYKKHIPIPLQKKLLNLLNRLEDEETPFIDNNMSKKKFKNYKDYKKEEAKLIIYNYGNKMTINIEFNSKNEITV